MENKFNGLPPNKRFRLMHHKNTVDNHHDVIFPVSSCLPAKKRKGSQSPPPSLTDVAAVSTTTYRLPAKKRICALPTNHLPEKHLPQIDLNLEYDPKVDESDIPIAECDSKKHSQSDEYEEEFDDGILCAVCQSTDGDPSDPIVFCDGCDLMVHTTCYGDPLTKGVPEGDWFCSQCQNSDKNKGLSCCLCPVNGGALKPTIDGRLAHILCALFVPEVYFCDPEGREGIDCSRVPAKRWGKRCYICKSSDGCAIDCSEPKCCLSFHVTCGLKEDLCIEYKEGRNRGAIVAGFCRSHSDLWVKQQTTGKYKIVAREDDEK